MYHDKNHANNLLISCLIYIHPSNQKNYHIYHLNFLKFYYYLDFYLIIISSYYLLFVIEIKKNINYIIYI